jgi:hypothetical protein
VASIHKDPRSPYFFCSFVAGDGKRKFRSTKTRDRKVALKVCLAWQDAAEKAVMN